MKIAASCRLALTVIIACTGMVNAPSAQEPSDAEIASRLERYLSQAEKDGFSGAVLVARSGSILLAKGYGVANVATGDRVSRDTVFTTGSITKQFTAAAIMKLESLGKLSVDDPIADYFDGVPPDKTGITIHQLLTHSAGFAGAIGDDFERVGRDQFVERAMASGLLFEPGTSYEYSNVGYSLLAAIVEKVSGIPYEDFLRKNFFEPAEMADTGYLLPKWKQERLAHGVTDDGKDWGTLIDKAILPDGPGWHLVGNGGIHSTTGDMYRWHLALEAGKVLPKSSVEKMYEPWVEEPGGTHYGYGWSIDRTPRKTRLVAHNGGNPYFFSDFWRFLDEDVVVYYSTNSRDRRFRRMARAMASIVFTGEAPPVATKSRALTGPAAPVDSDAGRWGMPDDPRAHVAARFLDALSLETDHERRGFVRGAFGDAVIERNGLEALAGLLARLRGDLGAFDYKELGTFGEHGVEIRLESREPHMSFRIQLELEAEEPYRIIGLGVEAGE